MPGGLVGYRIVCLSLIGAQLGLVALRAPACGSRRELGWFSVNLACAALYVLAPRGWWRASAAALLVWALGAYLGVVSGRGGAARWSAAVLGAAATTALLSALGLQATLPFGLLVLFAYALLAAYPLYLSSALCPPPGPARRQQRVFFAVLAALCVFLPAAGFEVLMTAMGRTRFLPLGPLALLPLVGVSLYLLGHEGYLQGAGWQEMYIRLGMQERRLASLYSRLAHTQRTLMLQDRLVALGALAAGAAHEFKNTLSSIQLSAEFGLSGGKEGEAAEALHLVVEHVRHGRRVAADLLESLAAEGRKRPERLVLTEALAPLARIMRASCRREGVRLRVEIPEELTLTARKGELEHILLNLVRNAASSLASAHQSAREVILRANRLGDQIVLEVVDSGEGVPVESLPGLFQPTEVPGGGSGVGLYLSRLLAERNAGTLEYLPQERGSCFRLTFPAG